MTEIWERDAWELADGIRRGELKSTEVLDAFLTRVEKFDPELHEALSAQPAEGTDSGVVLETVEKGYRLNGQILRPARVVVSK